MRPQYLLCAMSLGGCASSTGFTGARTVAPHEVSHVVALQGYVIRDDDTLYAVPVPGATYAGRVGLSNAVDLGLEASLVGQVRLDVKFNPVRSDVFDFALAPAGFFHLYGDTSFGGADLLAIGELHLGDSDSLFFSVGPGIGWTNRSSTPLSFGKVGLGGRFFVSSALALIPEVSTSFDPRTGAIPDVALGLGFGFGAQPNAPPDAAPDEE